MVAGIVNLNLGGKMNMNNYQKIEKEAKWKSSLMRRLGFLFLLGSIFIFQLTYFIFKTGPSINDPAWTMWLAISLFSLFGIYLGSNGLKAIIINTKTQWIKTLSGSEKELTI
jgi:pheromone shutdown protein TraB